MSKYIHDSFDHVDEIIQFRISLWLIMAFYWHNINIIHVFQLVQQITKYLTNAYNSLYKLKVGLPRQFLIIQRDGKECILSHTRVNNKNMTIDSSGVLITGHEISFAYNYTLLQLSNNTSSLRLVEDENILN